MYILQVKKTEIEKTLHDLIKKLKYFYIVKMNIRFDHLNSKLHLSDVQRNDRQTNFTSEKFQYVLNLFTPYVP